MIKKIFFILFIPTLIFSQQLNILSGWNLKGTFLDNVSINEFNNTAISSIWKWDNNIWKIWSPNNTIAQLINNYGIESIEKLASGDGFWINATDNLNLSITGNTSESFIFNIPSSGWYLKSLKINKETLPDIFKDLPINTLWKWNGDSWEIWSANENILNIIKDYGITIPENIKPGDGFWINSINTFSFDLSELLEESQCSSDNLTACITFTDCQNKGGYWYNNKCNEKKHPVNIYIFNDKLQILKGSILQNNDNGSNLLLSEGMITLFENNYNIEYTIKKAGYISCSIFFNKTPKANECYITDGYNYYVILADNRTDNKTMNFPLPYKTDFLSKEFIQSLLIPAKPALKPIFSFKKDAYLLIKRMNIHEDYTVSLNLFSTPSSSIYNGKGKALFYLSVGIENSQQKPVDKINGTVEVCPIVIVSGTENSYKNIFLYEKQGDKWSLVSPVFFHNNKLIPIYYSEDLTDYLFVQFSEDELTKIKAEVFSEDNKTLIEALVVGGKSSVVFTDENGYFELTTPEEIDSITICKTGYICKTFNKDATNFILSKNTDILSELPIDYYGETEKAVYQEPFYLNNKLIFTTLNGKVYSFNLNDNSLNKLEKDFNGYIYNSVNLINNSIIGITLNGALKIFNLFEPSAYEYTLNINDDMFFSDEYYYLFSPLTAGDNIYIPFIGDNVNNLLNLKFVENLDSPFYLTAIKDGISGTIKNLFIDNGYIIFGTTQGFIYILDNASLKVVSSANVTEKITSKIIKKDEFYFCGDWDGSIIKFNLNSLENYNKISIEQGLKIYNINLLENDKISLSTDKGVYILDPDNDFKIEKYFPTTSDVAGNVYFANGNYIFASVGGKVFKNNDILADINNKITAYKMINDKLIVFTEAGEVIELNLNN